MTSTRVSHGLDISDAETDDRSNSSFCNACFALLVFDVLIHGLFPSFAMDHPWFIAPSPMRQNVKTSFREVLHTFLRAQGTGALPEGSHFVRHGWRHITPFYKQTSNGISVQRHHVIRQ